MKKTFSYNKFINFILIAVILLGISCKSKKVSLIDASGALKSKSHNEVLDDILTHQLNYQTITTKGYVTLGNKKATTVFKIIKDEILQASVRPMLGIEAIRIDITPQKMVLIDRLEGRYAELDFHDASFNDLVALNFANLQALLTNQLFIAGHNNVNKSDYQQFGIGVENNQYILRTADNNGLNYMFSVDVLDRITSTIIHHDSKNITLKWDYNQFVEDDNFIYPTEMTANISINKTKMAIGISYSDLDINTDFKVDTSVSSKYKKVDILDLLGTYMKIK